MTATTRTAGTTHQRAIARHLDEFRAALEEQRVFRTWQLVELAAQDDAESSAAAEDTHYEVTATLRAGATRALREIDAAVKRIESGTYGKCTSCRGDIPLERLEILPMAGLCMRCAHARDRRSRAEGSR